MPESTKKYPGHFVLNPSEITTIILQFILQY